LEEVRAVEAAKDVVIDAEAIDESLATDGDEAVVVKVSLWVRFKTGFRGSRS
jgi:hypothetical protein